MSNSKWYKLKHEPVWVYRVGRYKVFQIRKKWNFEYYFFNCLVFDKGNCVASEGIFGSFLNTKTKAICWGLNKAFELKIIQL